MEPPAALETQRKNKDKRKAQEQPEDRHFHPLDDLEENKNGEKQKSSTSQSHAGMKR
ncbi:MAG TPA: hypothetical protein VFB38_04540 [Chthonomonadaceae bacterium]|nr:hypothetical protein [Chthonomonadaceae bacterium]